MSPMPATVKSAVWVSTPISRKWRFTDSHAPRAVMPITLWSYPADPPEANASPSQKTYSLLLRHDLLADAVVGNVEQSAQIVLVAGDSFLHVGLALRQRRCALEHETALRADRND